MTYESVPITRRFACRCSSTISKVNNITSFATCSCRRSFSKSASRRGSFSGEDGGRLSRRPSFAGEMRRRSFSKDGSGLDSHALAAKLATEEAEQIKHKEERKTDLEKLREAMDTGAAQRARDQAPESLMIDDIVKRSVEGGSSLEQSSQELMGSSTEQFDAAEILHDLGELGEQIKTVDNENEL